MHAIIVRIMNGHYANEWPRDDEKLGCCTFISSSEIYIYIFLEEGWMAMAIFGP